MKDEVTKGYLFDLTILLKERAEEAKLSRYNSNAENQDYSAGYLMAYHAIISLMKSQALAFNIDENEIGLADIDPERDLI